MIVKIVGGGECQLGKDQKNLFVESIIFIKHHHFHLKPPIPISTWTLNLTCILL
jgi:hypothetical protein